MVSSKVSTIRKTDPDVDNLNIRFVPRLEYREPFWFDPSTATGHSATGQRSFGTLEDKTRRKHTTKDRSYLNLLIPPDKIFQEIRMVQRDQRKRTDGYAQLCLTNEQVRGNCQEPEKRLRRILLRP